MKRSIVSCIQHAAMYGRLKFLELVTVILVSIMTDGLVSGGKTAQSISNSIKLEGSLSEHDVIIGSNINFTCHQTDAQHSSCGAIWIKDFKRLGETKDGRITWLPGPRLGDNRCSVSRIMIRNITYNDTGSYSCLPMNFVSNIYTPPDLKKLPTLKIYAVSCYQGYYCPTKEKNLGPIRCPSGTFSLYKNATSVEDCMSCPFYMNELESLKRMMEPKTVAMFQTNCHARSQRQESASDLSPSVKVATVVTPVVAVLALIMGVLYVIFYVRRSKKYHKVLLRLPRGVIYDPPKLPRSKDVFVCYSSKNREWVHEVLFPKLKAQDFKVFIDFVDFEIGVTIDDNIVKGIYGSRKTLFILSKDSLKSLYARKELYHALAAGKTGHQVLVILYEKCKAPAEIADIVYLDWTDMNNRDRFWERLYGAIRRPLANEVVHV